MPDPTPDEYRYAAAHMRAALDHLRLALHYAGSDQVCMDELAMETIPSFIEGVHRHCQRRAKGED